MSAYTITRTATPTIWVRKDDNGNVVTHEQTQEERMAHVVPPRRGEFRLKVVSFAEPFEMPRSEQFGGGVQQMTRLELEIQNGSGKGKRCTLLCGWSIGTRSNLGKVYTATTGKAVDKGGEYDLLDILGGEFTAYLMPSEKLDDDGNPRGTNCSWDTVAAVTDGAGGESDDWA